MRITQKANSQFTFNSGSPQTQIHFAAKGKKKKNEPIKTNTLTSSQHKHPDHYLEDEWEVVSPLKQEELKAEESEDSADLIDTPEPDDYISWRQQQEQKELEAIGKKFAVPGRALNSLEENTKTISRKIIAQTKDMAKNTHQALCRKTAQLLRKAAQSLDSSQES
jgi:hypothetical protein